jgi:hypothetical protein
MILDISALYSNEGRILPAGFGTNQQGATPKSAPRWLVVPECCLEG